MIKTESFWNEETEAPLMKLNRKFLVPEVEKNQAVFERVAKFPSQVPDQEKMSQIQEQRKTDPIPHLDEHDRIIVHDAERTFLGKAQRQTLMNVLSYASQKFGNYHQGLSFVSSFFLLTMDEATTVSLLQFIHENYIPGFWKSEPVEFAKDAYVFEHLLEEHMPELKQHLMKNAILPETYCQKWFISLCVHILPFEPLLTFYEKFLKRGKPFLFQFALSVMSNIKEDLLKCNDPSTIYKWLRLDSSLPKLQDNTLYNTIVEKSDTFDVSKVDFEALRQKVYEEKLKNRLASAAKAHAKKEETADDSSVSDIEEKGESDDEITDYDTEEEGEDQDDGSECQICRNMSPDYICRTCGKFICEMCKKKKHDKSHPLEHITDATDLESLALEFKNLALNQ